MHAIFSPTAGIDLLTAHLHSEIDSALAELALSDDAVFMELFMSLTAVALIAATQVEIENGAEGGQSTQAMEWAAEQLHDDIHAGSEDRYVMGGRLFPSGTSDHTRVTEFLVHMHLTLDTWMGNPPIQMPLSYVVTVKERTRMLRIAAHVTNFYAAALSQSLQLDAESILVWFHNTNSNLSRAAA
ncbi:hypothetical protein [Leifsonia sp. Leaf264]|uniref:hypothetical protein n=1 Tax=Leifsonia sp. Leaf264 TaxID=1736314 RepID=UPI0006F5E96F|nr:hypothetical protein [Leifsonia sp. Leaf264]KQO98540.1 hypothetical protein ASF30_10790 [Leifsonia sp. Leaf264]